MKTSDAVTLLTQIVGQVKEGKYGTPEITDPQQLLDDLTNDVLDDLEEAADAVDEDDDEE